MARILLATHGGPSADGAVRVAVQLARRMGAELDVVAVLEAAPVVDTGWAPVYVPEDPANGGVAGRLREEIRAQLARCGGHDLPLAGAPAVRFGSAAPVIIADARERNADVIVVGLGPHHLLDRALGGETALQLAQLATTPVLAVAEDAAALPRRVIAAIDFSDTSVYAARILARWMMPGDVLHLAHVAPAAGSAEEEAAGSAGTSARCRLEELSRDVGVPDGVRVELEELTGDPAPALLGLADRLDAQLIALGSHGYGVWRRLVLGSVASKVIRVATRSVLVVPSRCAPGQGAGAA